MVKKLIEYIYYFNDTIFPYHIYYNAEQCRVVDGVIERITKDYPQEKKLYEIYDIVPERVGRDIDLFIKLNKIDKEIMQLILPEMQIRKKEFEKTLPKKLLHINNPDIDDKYEDYLLIVKKRQKELLLIYENLCKKYFGNNKTSYSWISNPDKELPELYSLMINNYKLIAPETTLEQFKTIFTGLPIENIEPVKWHKDNATELLYFINRLVQSNNIVHTSQRIDYQKLMSCFVKPDGKQFNAVWKSLKTNLDIKLSQEKQKAIDELVNNF